MEEVQLEKLNMSLKAYNWVCNWIFFGVEKSKIAGLYKIGEESISSDSNWGTLNGHTKKFWNKFFLT